MNYDMIGQIFDIAACIIVVVSPKLSYDIIVLIKNMICSGKNVKHHTQCAGCTDSNPEPSGMSDNAFPTKPAAFPNAHSCDDSI